MGRASSRKGGIKQGHMKTLGDGYIHYLDFGDGFMNNTYVQTYQTAEFKHAKFIIFNCVSKVFLKKARFLYSVSAYVNHFVFHFFSMKLFIFHIT